MILLHQAKVPNWNRTSRDHCLALKQAELKTLANGTPVKPCFTQTARTAGTKAKFARAGIGWPGKTVPAGSLRPMRSAKARQEGPGL